MQCNTLLNFAVRAMLQQPRNVCMTQTHTSQKTTFHFHFVCVKSPSQAFLQFFYFVVC